MYATMEAMGPGCVAVDIKSDLNIWSFDSIGTSTPCSMQSILQNFDEVDRAHLLTAMEQQTKR